MERDIPTLRKKRVTITLGKSHHNKSLLKSMLTNLNAFKSKLV
jgi:hypothetical protein